MQVHPREDGFEIDGVLVVSESVMAEEVDAQAAALYKVAPQRLAARDQGYNGLRAMRMAAAT